MRVTWKHLAGFVIASAAIFAVGIAQGKYGAGHREASLGPSRGADEAAWHPEVEAPVREVSEHEATFAHEVPPYPGREAPEIATGEMRDLLGLPTKTKTFTTKDTPAKVLAFYDRSFRLKNYRVYTIQENWLTALAAIDAMRKYVFYITIIRHGPGQTRVFPAWVDGRNRPTRRQRMIPLDMGDREPIMVTGDSKNHEMAIYMVEEDPDAAHARYGRQLEADGWKITENKSPRGDAVARTQRLYVRENQELLISATRQGGNTVLFCLVGPRVG